MTFPTNTTGELMITPERSLRALCLSYAVACFQSYEIGFDVKTSFDQQVIGMAATFEKYVIGD